MSNIFSFKKIRNLYDRFDHWMDYRPPGSMSSYGWKSFEWEFRKNAPVRYYLTRTMKRKYVYPIKWKIRSLKEWIKYRTIDRYHVVRTGLAPSYYETSERMLHANFLLLIDFVEVESAWSKYIWSDDIIKAGFVERRLSTLYYLFKPFHRPDLGIAHLEWASTLDDPNLPVHERNDAQAIAARETLNLYRWWTEGRKARVPIEYLPRKNRFGGIDFFDDDEDEDDTEAEKAFNAERVARIHARHDQELDWQNEDTEMLVRLVKIRQSLWT